MEAQNFANHRVLPWPYLAAGLALLLNAGYLIYVLVRAPACGAGLAVASALALLVVWFKTRSNPQRMQDRIIRLEMQLRLRQVLPPERHGEIVRLTLPQLVGLRFASDAELPALITRVLAGELATQDAIKREVRDWQADWLRV